VDPRRSGAWPLNAVPLVVPDASVVLKWVLPSDDEPHADKALLLRAAIQDESVHVLLPGLWLFEVGNTIARRFPTHASAWLSALMKFGLEEASPSEPWLARTLELTRRYEVRSMTRPGTYLPSYTTGWPLIPPARRRKPERIL
jgi:hypothetical protein